LFSDISSPHVLCVLVYAITPAKKADRSLYEHPFDQASGNKDKISKIIEGIKDLITARFIRERFINKEFCQFVLDYAGFASMTKREFYRQITIPSSRGYNNVFDFLPASDIAWALMVYVDKEDEWKKPQGAATRTNKRKRDNAVWSNGVKGTKGAMGIPDEGRAFYAVFKGALKEIPVEEWDGVWTEFWSDFPKDSLFRASRARAQRNRWEDVVDDAVPDELDEEIEMPGLPELVA